MPIAVQVNQLRFGDVISIQKEITPYMTIIVAEVNKNEIVGQRHYAVCNGRVIHIGIEKMEFSLSDTRPVYKWENRDHETPGTE